jgi:hypothetical protein
MNRKKPLPLAGLGRIRSDWIEIQLSTFSPQLFPFMSNNRRVIAAHAATRTILPLKDGNANKKFTLL